MHHLSYCSRDTTRGVAITQQQCLERLKLRSPSFKRNNGRNHYFIFTDSRGACTLDGKFKDVEFLNHHVIGQHGERFKPDKYFFRRGEGPPLRCYDNTRDVNIPTPTVHSHPWSHQLEKYGVPTPNKHYLMFYAGWNYGTRMALVKQYRDDPDQDVFVRKRVSAVDYVRSIKHSRYCPICGGFSQWTPRLTEAIHYGCVPVILSDEWELPFSDILNWSLFSVRVPASEVSTLKSRLRSLDYQSLYTNVMKVRSAFVYHLHAYTGDDMFPFLMYSMYKTLKFEQKSLESRGIMNYIENIEPDRDYNRGVPSHLHTVSAASSYEYKNKKWTCKTQDGYNAECSKQNTIHLYTDSIQLAS